MAAEYATHNLIPTPASHAAAITPSDDADLTFATRAIYVGTTGDLTVILRDDTAPVTLKSAAVGYHPIQARRVMATDTTATNLVALY